MCSLSCKQPVSNTVNEDDGTDVWAEADLGLVSPRDRPNCGGCRNPMCANTNSPTRQLCQWRRGKALRRELAVTVEWHVEIGVWVSPFHVAEVPGLSVGSSSAVESVSF